MMESTSLTIGGFSQPGVARTLIEQPGSIETGLAQRFLWLFPKPSYARFGTLEAVEKDFTRKKSCFLHLCSRQKSSGIMEISLVLWMPGKSWRNQG